MSPETRIGAVVGFGILTAVVLALGAGTIGGLMAVVQLGGLIGAPTAALLVADPRSRAAAVVLASVLSVAVTAIAVQSLVWFELASAELIVLLATAYGAVVARLLSTPSQRQPARGLGRW